LGHGEALVDETITTISVIPGGLWCSSIAQGLDVRDQLHQVRGPEQIPQPCTRYLQERRSTPMDWRNQSPRGTCGRTDRRRRSAPPGSSGRPASPCCLTVTPGCSEASPSVLRNASSLVAGAPSKATLRESAAGSSHRSRRRRHRSRSAPPPRSGWDLGPGHPAVRAGPGRLRPGTGRGPPDVGNGARQPRRSASKTQVEGGSSLRP
jgi:hypothetical protein